MAARFIDIDNFTGFYEINESYYDSVIVADVEEQILRDLLGNTLYSAFIADLTDNEPKTQKWINFKDGEDYTDTILIHYKGISEMLVAFAFSALVIDVNNSNSTGFTKNLNQNSRVYNSYEREQLSNKAYNKGVNFYVQCEKFLSNYPDDFTDWYHKQKAYKNLIKY